MPREWSITRDEGELLVDLLEDCDPKEIGTWRHDLAAEVRELFGMCTFEKSKEIEAELKKAGHPGAKL